MENGEDRVVYMTDKVLLDYKKMEDYHRRQTIIFAIICLCFWSVLGIVLYATKPAVLQFYTLMIAIIGFFMGWSYAKASENLRHQKNLHEVRLVYEAKNTRRTPHAS